MIFYILINLLKSHYLNHSTRSYSRNCSKPSPASHEELDQLLIVVVVQKLLERAHLPCDIMTALYLGSVSVQVGDDPPQVSELPRLHLELGTDGVGILEYIFVVFGHKVHVIFLELELLQAINQLILLGDQVLLLNERVKQGEVILPRRVLQVGVHVQDEFLLIGYLRQFVLKIVRWCQVLTLMMVITERLSL